jgi:pimeloyl-ACP methyl ester carboxylesterase
MFGRDQLRAAGRDYRRALQTPAGVPVLTVRGSADRLLTAAAMLPLATPADHRHVEVTGAGHLPHEEAPDAVSAALLDWLPG